MTEVAVLVPVLNRPHRVEPLLASVYDTTDRPFRVLFITDPDDDAERAEIDRLGAVELVHGGSYPQKINAGVAATDSAYVFLAADDLRFHPHWFERAAARMTDRIGVVGTNDLGNRRVVAGDHATHSLVARWYCDLGTIDGTRGVLHEGYHHNFCDDEFVATAKHRDAWAFAADSVVEHLHPHWGKGAGDETYNKGQATFRLDRKVFARRRRLWTSQ